MKIFVYELHSRKRCLWFIAKSFKLNRSLLLRVIWTTFMTLGWIKPKINRMSNVITDGSTLVIRQPTTFENGCIITIIWQGYILCKNIFVSSFAQFVLTNYCTLTVSFVILVQFWCNGDKKWHFKVAHLVLCIFILYHFLQN